VDHERRDVLCGVFFLLAIVCYLRAVDGGSTRSRWYWAAVALAALALLSKAMAVTLPSCSCSSTSIRCGGSGPGGGRAARCGSRSCRSSR